MNKPDSTRTLGQAICDHLKLDAGRVASDYTLTHSQGAARVSLTVFLTAEDMASIMSKAGAKSIGRHHPGGLALTDAGKDELVVIALKAEPGPELINFRAPTKGGRSIG